MSEKFECDFRGCKVKPEELTTFSKVYPYSATKLMVKIEGHWFCKEHTKQMQAELDEEIKALPKVTVTEE